MSLNGEIKLKNWAVSIDRLNHAIGRIIAWCALAAVLITFVIVVLRYGFDWNSIALQESVIYFHAALFMAGAAYTLQQDAHVRVDIFYRDSSPLAKARVNLMGALLFLIPFCVFILIVSFEYVSNSWAIFEGSRETGGIPALFILKTLIPVMAFLLLLQAIANALQALHTLRGHA